uniref:Uncharacterized protein n=1 Tax=Rhizophora mucronata TaxID=61149 RepID=A0A2P2NPU4_RHIMU
MLGYKKICIKFHSLLHVLHFSKEKGD